VCFFNWRVDLAVDDGSLGRPRAPWPRDED
jgi:hypothetical protein